MKPSNYFHVLVTMFSGLSIFAQTTSPRTKAIPLTAPPDLMSEAEADGIIDMVFYIQSLDVKQDGSQILELAATYQNKPVGITVALSSAWKAGTLGQLVIHQGTVTIKSPGISGNNFVFFLHQLYKTRRNPKRMKPSVEFSVITLGGDPAKLTSEPVQFKLFYESKDPEGNAEIFLNIDMKNHRAHLDEKDEDYRKPLVAAFGD